jgi:hypothetical protein
MPRTRQLLIAIMAMATVLAAAPAFGQTGTTAPPAPVQKQQGLGIFVQGGYVQSSTYSSNGLPNMTSVSPKGGIIGIGFGGNKSGTFGVGVDLNYIFNSAKDVTVLNIGEAIAENGTLKSQILDIPVYGRFNIGGHNTKNAPTFYIPAGWFFDVLIKSDVDGVDVMNAFNGFSTGPLVGAGFEVARIGVEARGMWTIKELQSTGGGTFLNGMQDSKVFTFVLLFKVRLN